MKIKLIFSLLILSSALISTCTKEREIEISKLQNRGDLVYEINQEKSYSGKVISSYENGQKKEEINYKKGKKNGIHIGWYENGQMRFKENYKNNKPKGVFVYWSTGGTKLVDYTTKKVFRSKSKILIRPEDMDFIKSHDMYDNVKNPSGKGLHHQYSLIFDNKVVFDQAYGLMWQQSGSDETLIDEEAEDYITKVNRIRFAGCDDWRLPTVEEAMSLMEPKNQSNNLYIDPIFDNTQKDIWTGDHLYIEQRGRSSELHHLVVNFSSGRCHHFLLLQNFRYYVRAVRSR